MLKSDKSNEDPGGAEPRFHDGVGHRPIVTITNSKKEVVQFSPEVVYPHSSETLLRLKSLLSGLNSGSISGGILREPAGEPQEGTVTYAYPVTFAAEEHAAGVEAALAGALSRFAEETPGASFRGFVPDAKKAIVAVLTQKAREEHERRMSAMAAPRLRVVGDDGDVTDTDGSGATVGLGHADPAGHGQPREGDRDGIGAETARA